MSPGRQHSLWWRVGLLGPASPNLGVGGDDVWCGVRALNVGNSNALLVILITLTTYPIAMKIHG